MAATEKQNDMLLNVISNPSYTAMDFMDVGLSSENTNMLPYETYRDNEEIQKMFTKNGVFDEQSLKNAYNVASAMMFDMASNTMNQQIAKDFEFQPGSLFALSYDNPKFNTDLTNDTFETEFGKGAPINPDRTKYGIAGVGLQSPNKYSRRELAQMSKTWDSEKQEWIESPEEWFGEHWLENLFNPRVYAKYTKDDPEVQRGEKQEGEYKISPWGTYYTELLNGRPTYNQEIVSYFDTLTKEDSWINRYDFFDSDDKEKSLIGSVFRNLALAAPLAIPGVAPIYLGISTGLQASSLIAGIMKAAVGSDSATLNNVSGFLKQFDMSTSDYSQENTWTMENLVNMAGQVFLQLKQQRFLFEQTPKLFGYKQGMDPKAVEKMVAQTRSKYVSDITKKFTSDPIKSIKEMTESGMGFKELISRSAQYSAMKDIMAYEKGAQRIGSILSKAYMTGITTIDSYDEAKQQGAEDWQAMLIALGYSAAEYRLLSTGIGEMVMPELRASRRMLQQAIKKGMGISDDMIKEAANSGAMYTREGRNTLAKKLIGLGKDLAEGVYHGKHTIAAIAANGLGEGIEEMSEEALYDMVKTANNTLSWLTGGEFKPLKAWDNMFDRYAMSFIGGAIGGSAFNASTTFRSMKGIENMTNEQAQNTILFMLRDHKRDEIEKVLNKTTFNIKSLKNIQYDNKEHVTLFEEGDEYDNLDKLAKDQFRKVLDDYQVMLDSEGFNKSDSELFNSILPDYRYAYINKTMAAAIHMSGFQNALNDFANAYKNYNIARNVALTGSPDTTPTDSELRAVTDDEKAAAIKAAEEQLNVARQKVKSYMDGLKAKDFIMKGTFEMDPYLNKHINTITFGSFSRFRTGKDVSELSPKELADIGREFEEMQKAEGKEQLNQAYNYWLAMLKAVNPILSEANERIYQDMENNKGLMAMLTQVNRTASNLISMFGAKEKGEAMSDAAQASVGDIIQGLTNGKLLYIDENGRINGLDESYTYGEKGGPGFKEYVGRRVNEEGFNQFKKDNPGLSEEDAIAQFDSLTDDQKYELAIKNNGKRTGYSIGALQQEMLTRYVRDYTTQAMQSLEELSKASYVPSEVKQQALQVIETLRNLMINQKYNSNWGETAELMSQEIDDSAAMLYDTDAIFDGAKAEGLAIVSDSKGNSMTITPEYIIKRLLDKINNSLENGVYSNFNDATASMHGFMYDADGTLTTVEDMSIDTLIEQFKRGEKEWRNMLDKAIEDAEGDKEYKDRLENIKAILFGGREGKPGVIRMAEELSKIIDSSYENTLYYDEKIMGRLDAIKSEITNKPHTPVYDLLDRFQIDDKGTKASDVIKAINEKLAGASMDPSVFVLSNEEQEAVNNLKSEIEHFESAIYASREDGSNSHNPFGFVNTYNKLMKDEEGFVQMNTIKSDFANRITSELDTIKNRIKLLIKLSAINGTNKLNENKKIEINKAILSYDSISSFINELNKYNEKAAQKVQSILNDKEYKDKVEKYRNLRDNEKAIEPDDAEIKKMAEYTLRLERAFHEMISEGEDGMPISDSIIEKVISGFDPFVHNVESINGDTRSFDMNTSLWYLTSLMAADPVSISYAVTKAYTQLPDIAPTAQQVMALKGLLSFMTGRNTYARMSRIFRKSVLNKAKQMLLDKESAKELERSLFTLGINDGNIGKYISNFDKLSTGTEDEKKNMRILRKQILFGVANSKSFNLFENMYWIGGIPGSGKTMAVAVAAIKALYANDGTEGSETEIVAGGRNLIENEGITIVSKKDVADKLKKNINSKISEIDEKNITTYSIEKFLGEFLSISDTENAEADFGQKDNVTIDTSDSGDFIIHSTISKRSENVPKLILIDEGTLLNQMQMDAIDRMAGETGALVIVFGDEDQIKRMGKIPEVTDKEGTRFSSDEYVYPIAESQFPHSPKIGTSMRSNNTQKEYNRLIIKKKKEEVYKTGKFGDPIKLKYGEKEDGLYGEQIISPSKDRKIFDSRIEKMKKDIDRQIAMGIKQEDVEKIGLVGSKDNAYIKELLNSKDADKYFEHMESPIQTQGLEKKYYIYVDSSFNNPAAMMNVAELFNNMDAFYTVTSRSKQFTLIVNSDEYNGSITSEQDDRVVMSNYDINAIRSYNTSYTGIMNSIFDDLNKDGIKVSQLALSVAKTAKKPTVRSTPKSIEVPGEVKSGEVHKDIGDGKKDGDSGESSERPGSSGKIDKGKSEKTEPFDIAGRQWDKGGGNPLNNDDGGLGTTKSRNLKEVVEGDGKTRRKMTDKEAAIDNASESHPEEFLASGKDNSYTGMLYSHAVDSIGSGVQLDYTEHRIHLNGYDSQGFNGIGKMLYLLQERDMLPDWISVQEYKPEGVTSGVQFFDIVFNSETNADSDMRSFIMKTHKYLVAMRDALISGRSSTENSIDTKVTMLHEITNAYLSDVLGNSYSMEGGLLDGTVTEFWFKKTDIGNRRTSGTAKTSTLVPFQTANNKTFESQMSVTDEMPRSTIVATVNLNGYTLIEIPIGTIESPATKLKQSDFDNGIVKWANENTGNTDPEISNAANTILNILKNGIMAEKYDSSLYNASLDAIRNLIKLSRKEGIDQQIRNQAAYMAMLSRVFIKNMPDVVKLDGDAREALGYMISSGVFRRSKEVGLDYTTNHTLEFVPMPIPVGTIKQEGIFDMSDMYILHDNITDNDGNVVINAGHPFVLIGINNPDINNADALEEYKRQVDTGVDHGIRAVYVNPPLVKLDDFFGKLKAIFNVRSKDKENAHLDNENKLIGNMFTAYRLMEALFVNEDSNVITDESIETVISEIGDTLRDMYIPEGMAEVIGVTEDSEIPVKGSYKVSHVIRGIINYMNKLENEGNKNGMFEFLVNNNRYINYILIQLAYGMDADGNINFDNTNVKYERLTGKLKEKGIEGVFLNVLPDENGWVRLGDNNITYARVMADGGDSYSMNIGGDNYSFTYFGKLETPCASLPMEAILETVVKAYGEVETDDMGRNTPYQKRINSYIKMHRSPFNFKSTPEGTEPPGGGGTDSTSFKTITKRRVHQYPDGSIISYGYENVNIPVGNNETFIIDKEGNDIIIIRQGGDTANTELDFYIIKGGLFNNDGSEIGLDNLHSMLFEGNEDKHIEIKGNGVTYQIDVDSSNNTISISPISSIPNASLENAISKMSEIIGKYNIDKNPETLDTVFDELGIDKNDDKSELLGKDGLFVKFANAIKTSDPNKNEIAKSIIKNILDNYNTEGSVINELSTYDDIDKSTLKQKDLIEEIRIECKEVFDNPTCLNT